MDGVINLYKPTGISSHQAITEVKKILKVKKAGHAGTLDPLAEGVLLVCIGEATKISRFLTAYDKEYLATLKLGEKTDTLDAEGRILETRDISAVGIHDLEEAMSRFQGEIRQVPPMYSAIKSNGIPLYRLARKGHTIERDSRNIAIYTIEIVEFEKPMATIRIQCSKGTYVRSLVNDIGEYMNTGAHLVKLIRTKVDNFDVKDSASLKSENIKEKFITIDDALCNMDEISLKKDAYMKAKNGVPIFLSDENILKFERTVMPYQSGFYRLKDHRGMLFAIARIEKDFIRIERMLLTKLKEVF